MTVQHPSNHGDLVAIRADRGNVASLQGVAVAPRDNPVGPLAPAADLSKVVPFVRPRRGAAAESSTPGVMISPAERPAPLSSRGRRWLQALLLTISLIMHGGVLYLFWREPEPRAGIGIEAISVDIVVGDNRPAGAAPTPGESSIQSSRVDETKPTEMPVEKVELAEAPAVKADDARGEIVKEQPGEQPKELEPERQKIAMIETPQAAEIPTVRPRETPPDAKAVIAPPREQPRRGKPEPKQKKAEQAKLEYHLAGGRGESTMSSVANYNGLVSAHLRRFQRYPDAAERSGIAGGGIVSFTINSAGSVTSARVARGTGAAILDQEMTAMVHRAAPFPAPPDGQAKSFAVVVDFKSPK